MTVSELIELLSAMPSDSVIQIAAGGCRLRPLSVAVPDRGSRSRPLVVIAAQGWFR